MGIKNDMAQSVREFERWLKEDAPKRKVLAEFRIGLLDSVNTFAERLEQTEIEEEDCLELLRLFKADLKKRIDRIETDQATELYKEQIWEDSGLTEKDKMKPAKDNLIQDIWILRYKSKLRSIGLWEENEHMEKQINQSLETVKPTKLPERNMGTEEIPDEILAWQKEYDFELGAQKKNIRLYREWMVNKT